MKYCTNCGNELREKAKFCEKCGTARVGEEINQQPTQQINQQVQNKSSNKTLIIILIIIGACFLIGIVSFIGVVAYIVYEDSIREINEYGNDYNYDYYENYGLNELIVGNLSLYYPEEWTELPRTDDTEKILIRDKSTIRVSVQSPKHEITESDIAEEIKKEISENNYVLTREESIFLSDFWKKYTFIRESDNYVYICIFKVENNSIYRFDYVTAKKNL